MVALPLAIQGGIYLKLKADLSQLERETQALDIRRDVVNRVNQCLLYSFYGFQSLMQFKLYGKTSSRDFFESYTNDLVKHNDELASIIESKQGDRLRADRIRHLSREYIVSLKGSQFNPSEGNQVVSISEDILRNVRFRDAARDLFTALKDLGQSEQEQVTGASGREASYRRNVQQATDLTVLLNSLVAIILAIVFVRGTVSKLNILKDNTRRFAAGKGLAERLGTSDEIGELDGVFHNMVEALTEARLKEKYMTALLQDSKERLESLINNIPAALVVMDEAGRIQSINPAAERLFLYSNDAVSQTPVDKLFARVAKGETLFDKLKTGSSSHPVALEALSSEQEIIAVEAAVTHFEGPDGKSILATIIDVTERYKLEALKRDFYAMVSHDIRTPLTTISGVLQLSRLGRYGPVSEELATRLGMAEANTHRLLEMVSKLLDVDKLEDGTVELNIDAVPVRFLAGAAMTATVAQCEEKGIKISCIDRELAVKCDAHYLSQVMINLVANAIRYSPQYSSVLIEAQEQPGGIVCVSISDQGPGVPEKMRASIFERFKQADSRRDQKSGFGLGLSICKSIIDLHGGEIGVDPVNAAAAAGATGARFWFKLGGAERQ